MFEDSLSYTYSNWGILSIGSHQLSEDFERYDRQSQKQVLIQCRFHFLTEKKPTDVLVCYFEFVNMNVDVYINAIYNKKYKVLQDKSIITEPIPFRIGVVQPTTSREYDFTWYSIDRVHIIISLSALIVLGSLSDAIVWVHFVKDQSIFQSLLCRKTTFYVLFMNKGIYIETYKKMSYLCNVFRFNKNTIQCLYETQLQNWIKRLLLYTDSIAIFWQLQWTWEQL